MQVLELLWHRAPMHAMLCQQKAFPCDSARAAAHANTAKGMADKRGQVKRVWMRSGMRTEVCICVSKL
eukprot:1156437-Pelagomonas_calceolata.AAC.16